MKKCLGWIAVLLAGSWVHAAEVPQQRVLANETALAYSTTYYMDISAARSVAMQVVYGSATVASKTFTDGSKSTGSLTVASFAALSSATATAQVRIASNTALANQTLFVAGTNIPIRVDVLTSSNTACNIAADIASFTNFLSTCAIGSATGIVFTTATTFGASYNGFSVQSTSLTAISSSPFSGGQDNQTVTIGTITLQANRDFYPVTSNAVTAQKLMTAINNRFATIVSSASGTGANTVVTTTSTAIGTASNYAMTSSSNGALSLSGTVVLSGSAGTSAMTGGTNPAFSANSAVITIPAHGFTTALPVLLSTGGATITGLVNQTTYYVIVVDANNIKLGSSSQNAVAGTSVTVTAVGTPVTTDTLTLAPLAILGTPSFKWQVSNDQTNWMDWLVNESNIAITSTTLSSYVFPSSTTIWDPGAVGYNYLNLKVVGPTQGGIVLKATVSAKP